MIDLKQHAPHDHLRIMHDGEMPDQVVDANMLALHLEQLAQLLPLTLLVTLGGPERDRLVRAAERVASLATGEGYDEE